MSFGTDQWHKWLLNKDKALPLLKAAWDAGINSGHRRCLFKRILSPTNAVTLLTGNQRVSEIIVGKYQSPREKLVIPISSTFSHLPEQSNNICRWFWTSDSSCDLSICNGSKPHLANPFT